MAQRLVEPHARGHEVALFRTLLAAGVMVAGQVAATGGVLFHYNPPFADIYIDVAPPFRRMGYG